MDIPKEYQMIFDIIKFIYTSNEREQYLDYAVSHPQLVKAYATVLNNRMNLSLDQRKLDCVAYAHDILKDRGLVPTSANLIWNKHEIPQDLNRYVRFNLDILEEFGMEDYFNSDAGLHALAAGIFLRKEFGITDPEIIYPIMFHSCPIMSIYHTLPQHIRDMCDVIILSDKLASSSHWIQTERPVICDLDLLVFGTSGLELNYSIGLYVAMIMKRGDSKGEQSRYAVEYYKDRCRLNPLISNWKIGGRVQWPVRKSLLSMTP